MRIARPHSSNLNLLHCGFFQADWKGDDDNDFNQTIILEEIKQVLTTPGMMGKQSVLLFNVGIHYSLVLNFTAYRRLIENVVTMLTQGTSGEANDKTPSSQALLIWRSSTAVEREDLRKLYSGDNLTKWRFHSSPVRVDVQVKMLFSMLKCYLC